MSPHDFGQLVIAERAALATLQRRLKAVGSRSSARDDLAAADAAWKVWRELAAQVRAAGIVAA